MALCPRCWSNLECAHCRAFLTVRELLDHLTDPGPQGTDTGEPVSSAGRTPMHSTPRTRAAFTTPADEPYGDAPGFIRDVARAERAVGLAEADSEAAHAELREARAVCPEQAERRVLSPGGQAAVQRVRDAETQAQRADDALTVARRRLAVHLAEFERATQPLPAWYDDSEGLADIDRDRHR
jgi:hypothetical protein